MLQGLPLRENVICFYPTWSFNNELLPGLVTHAYNPSTPKGEAGGMLVGGCSFGYTARPCLKTKQPKSNQLLSIRYKVLVSSPCCCMRQSQPPGTHAPTGRQDIVCGVHRYKKQGAALRALSNLELWRLAKSSPISWSGCAHWHWPSGWKDGSTDLTRDPNTQTQKLGVKFWTFPLN
jgi:hypothetical protein